jgi:hypothetical protein
MKPWPPKLLQALALLICTVCFGISTASALTITDGLFFSSSLTTSFGDVSGDGFAISYRSFIPFEPAPIQRLNFLASPGGSNSNNGQITVGQDICRWGFQPGQGFQLGDCGFLTLIASTPIPPNPTPGQVFFTDPIHFVAAGHLNVGTGYDVFGAGSLTGAYCTSVDCSLNPFLNSIPSQSWVFSVPEPSTFLLLFTGLSALALRLRRRPRSWA